MWVVGEVDEKAKSAALTEAGVVREDAYAWVQESAMRVWDEGIALRDSLGENDEVILLPAMAGGC